MADNIQKIYATCKRCGGTGEEPIGYDKDGNPLDAITCRKCAGNIEVSNKYLSSDLIDLFNDIMNKCNDIFEKVNE